MRALFSVLAMSLLLTSAMCAPAPSLGLASVAPAPGPAQTSFNDIDILQFALNLECFEGEFYNYVAGNGGLSAADRGGGPVPIGGQAAPLSSEIQAIAQEIALNEKTHVQFLRQTLGNIAVPCPLLNLTAFSTVFNAAVASLQLSFAPPFSPYSSDLAFLLTTFLLEDIGSSAYQGAAPLIVNKTYLAAAAGNFAVESYQAGFVRYYLYNIENNQYQVTKSNSSALWEITGGLAELRFQLGGGSDQNVITHDGGPQIVPVNNNSQTYPRTTSQILSISTGGAPNNQGGFFPNGFNGNIK